jgi:hypothetical protein
MNWGWIEDYKNGLQASACSPGTKSNQIKPNQTKSTKITKNKQ